jgi:hypothetical protein
MGAGLIAGSASAAGPITRIFHAPPEQIRRTVDFRAVPPPPIGLPPIHEPGMFAERNVAPNMRIGVGMFGSRRSEVGTFEAGPGSRSRSKRKLGLSFNWRF